MDISQIRKEIDSVDGEILRLFLRRMELSGKAAEYKSLPVENKQHESEILKKVTEEAGEKERYAYHLFSTLFELSRSYQAELISKPSDMTRQIEKSLEAGYKKSFPQTGTVACQGVEGANSQMACRKLLPRGNIVFVKTFDAVVSAVERGLCKFGVLPIENSSNGSVRQVYELMRDRRLSIVRSVRLCINHRLLGLPGAKLSDLRVIYSHEQALGQCSKFLSSLENVTLIPCSNTALAAKFTAEGGDPHIGAISSHACASIYGLSCISHRVQNSDNNYTRFICIAKEPEIYAGANRISLILSFENRPGALYEIISRLAALHINLTKLESCPVPGSDFEFIFFIEIDASAGDPGVLAMLGEMERSCASMTFLGNYAEI